MLVAHADDGHGYETVFFVRPVKRRKLDLDAIRDRLGVLGESVIVAGDHGEAKVHVHNERPDEILAYGLSLGTLSDITVVNLDHQTAEVRGKRVGELTGGGKAGSGRRRRQGRPGGRGGRAAGVDLGRPAGPQRGHDAVRGRRRRHRGGAREGVPRPRRGGHRARRPDLEPVGAGSCSQPSSGSTPSRW